MGMKRKMDAKLKMYCHARLRPSRTSASVTTPMARRAIMAQQRAAAILLCFMSDMIGFKERERAEMKKFVR